MIRELSRARLAALVGASVAAIALAAPAAAQETAQDKGQPQDTGEIVVTGQRAAQQAGVQIKRSADSLVESLVATDVGKLPDQNVAEAVRRLPGVSVANDQGEGRYVIIRGVNPNLVNVTVNGQTQPAPEPDGRQVKLDDIPSALIAAVTIAKSLTPDQDANAIGGAVDIRTLSAFDRSAHLFLDARGQVGRYQLDGKHPYEGDIEVGGRSGDFGAVASFSYSRRPIESENFQGSTTFLASGGPDQFGLRDYNLTRTRIGGVLNLDWHPSDVLKLYARGTYSKFDDDEVRDQNRVDSLVYNANGTYTGRGSVLVRRRNEKDNTKSITLGGSLKFAGGGVLDMSGNWASAIKNDPLRSEYNFRTASTTAISGSYDLSQSPTYGFTFATPFGSAVFPLNSVNYDHRHAQEDIWQSRGDLTMPVDLGSDSSVKVGGKFLYRHKTNDRDYIQYGRTGTFNASSVSYTGDTDFYDGLYVLGPRIDYNAAQAFVAANTVLTQSASNLQSSRANSLVNDYDVREKIVAGYAMATLRLGRFTLIPGVRIERTSDDARGKLITAASTPTQGFNSYNSRAYTDVFPGVNARFDVDDRLVLRGAVTTAIGRPNYPDLSPFISVDTTASPVTVTEGNPAVKTYKALNLDAAAEYYLSGHGVLSVGVFYKHIDDPIYTQTTIVTGGTFAGQTFATANVVQPVNASTAVLRGIEFNAQFQLSALPSPLDGLGVAANFTIVGGHGAGLGARAGEFPLFFQSKNVGTAQIFYEKYGITGRVAFSYRSAYLDTIGTSAATDQYTDNNGQLDARIGYAIGRHFEVYLEGVNLTDAPWRRYIGTRNQLVERERYDTTYRVGAQIRF